MGQQRLQELHLLPVGLAHGGANDELRGEVELLDEAGEMRTSDALVDALCAAAVSVPTDRDVRQADAS